VNHTGRPPKGAAHIGVSLALEAVAIMIAGTGIS